MEAFKNFCRNEHVIKTCLLILFLIFVILLAVFTRHAAETHLQTGSLALFKQYSDQILI